MKQKINEAQTQIWDDFLSTMDYRTDGRKGLCSMNTFNNKTVLNKNQPLKTESTEVIDPNMTDKEFNKHCIKHYKLRKEQKSKKESCNRET